jgi:hypothetical protein
MAFKVARLLTISLVAVCSGHSSSSDRKLTYLPGDKKESVILYGNIHTYAYWFVDLLVGTPPQRTSVIVDTGSSVCAFACDVCKNCGNHIDKSFSFEASSTASWSSCNSDCPSGSCVDNHCSYSITYSEGSSLSGYWFTDTVRLGDLEEENLPTKSYLGCHTSETNLFFTQSAGGILGLAPHRSGNYPSILGSLFTDPRIDKKVFSLCLAREGGELTVGGHNGIESDLIYIPMKMDTFFTVSLSEMSIGPLLIGSVFGPAVVDSGTTLTYFPPEVYKKLSEVIESAMKAKSITGQGARCWSTNETKTFPTISMSFEANRITLFWEPDHYLYSPRDGLLCYAFASSENSRETVLGASFLVMKNVVFDLSRGRLGIAHHDCPSNTIRPEHVLPKESSPETTTAEPQVQSSDGGFSVSTTIEPKTLMIVNALEETTRGLSKPGSPSLWWVWLLVVSLTVLIFVLVYRRWLSRTPTDPERERLSPLS